MSDIDQILKATLGNAKKLCKDYEEGAFLSMDKTGAFIKYNTGDCIWFVFRDGEYQVSFIDTYDDHRVECASLGAKYSF